MNASGAKKRVAYSMSGSCSLAATINRVASFRFVRLLMKTSLRANRRLVIRHDQRIILPNRIASLLRTIVTKHDTDLSDHRDGPRHPQSVSSQRHADARPELATRPGLRHHRCAR